MNARTDITPAETATPGQTSEIISAIVKAMGAIKKVGKGGTNTHDKYNFASIDNFLELVNPICAEAGLFFHMQEVGMEDFNRKGKFGDNAWMRCSFDITAYHVSGQSLPPVRRTVEVLRNGAQAYGSAQSYALKQFLRSLFLIPTGDKDDADYAAQADGPIEQPRQPEPPRSVSAEQFTILRDLIEETGTDIGKFLTAYRVETLPEFPAAQFERAKGQLEKKKEQAQ